MPTMPGRSLECHGHGVPSAENASVCVCAVEWTGADCSLPRFPACRLTDDATPIRCASLRKVSPVACACLRQCLDAGEDVCAPGSYGCELPWLRVESEIPRLASRHQFWDALLCFAVPGDEEGQTSALPQPPSARLLSFSAYMRGERSSAISAHRPAPFASHRPRFEDVRRGGREPLFARDAVMVPETECGTCNGRGRCVREQGWMLRCVCVDGYFGPACDRMCSNDCFHHCSGNGECLHGWCLCRSGWSGVDCSRSLLASVPDSVVTDADQFGRSSLRPPRYDELPDASMRAFAGRLEGAVHVYDLPPRVNRFGGTELWMQRQWHAGAFRGQCDEVHKRRIYAAEAHFDALLMRDGRIRAANASAARLHYVPLFLSQRMTWGADASRVMLKALDYIRHAYPHWNRTGGRDHAWFVYGERMTCTVPEEIRKSSIILGHWGDLDCVDARKDVIVPPISPLQHDHARYVQNMLPFLRGRRCARSSRHGCTHWTTESTDRDGPLLFFAGGIVSFGASQDNMRRGGRDTDALREKWSRRVDRDPCAFANVTCRAAYSMGVRQTVWRSGLWRESDVRIVSAGVDDYMQTVGAARFCLHTEGNGFGIRLIDYMVMGCVPVIVNDRMLQVFENIIDYDHIAVRASKRDIPTLLTRLRDVDKTHHRSMLARAHIVRRMFAWYRPDGLAYEATIAALGQRVSQFG